MSITRSNHKRGFLMLDAEVLRKRMLSLEALGLFVAMLDRSDDWDFYAKELSATFRLTRERTDRLLNELERKGFVRAKAGRYGPAYDLVELPERYLKTDAAPPAPPGQTSARPHIEASSPPDPEDDGERKAAQFFALAKRLNAQKDMTSGT